MKIVHISTFDFGGAANSAIRLHNGLLQEGVESFFMTTGKSNNVIINKIEIEQKKLTIIERILNRLQYKYSEIQKNHKIIQDKKGEYEVFTFPQTNYQLHKHHLIKEADIIHLHWIGNFVDISSFFNKIKKPIVWTLHDMNPFLGGFHYLGDKLRIKEFQQIENYLVQIKEKVYAKKNNLTIVTPSIWLGDESKKSKLLHKFPHLHIIYGLDTTNFKSYNPQACRQLYGIPQNKKILLFVSESLNNYRKGFDILLSAIKQLKNEDVHLVCLGDAKQLNDNKIQQIGYKKSEIEIAQLYSAADVFILPSREDNLPNVMLESLCCGTPVISFNIGGMKDQIIEEENGYLAKDVSSDSLLQTINMFLSHGVKKSREEISKESIEKYSLKVQAVQYLKLYKKILN